MASSVLKYELICHDVERIKLLMTSWRMLAHSSWIITIAWPSLSHTISIGFISDEFAGQINICTFDSSNAFWTFFVSVKNVIR